MWTKRKNKKKYLQDYVYGQKIYSGSVMCDAVKLLEKIY